MNVLTIVGARPNFVKAAMVSRAFVRYPNIRERILHTGQHYDLKMSRVFFTELAVPKPYKNLGIHSSTLNDREARKACIARMTAGIEKACLALKPDWLLVYGDANSTLAGGLAGSKLRIPVAHVEAGLRSFNRKMPEESNRIRTDRVSTLLFAPTQEAVFNLRREGVGGKIHRIGDVMVDALFHFRRRALALPVSRARRLVPSGPFFLLTVHRQENADDAKRLAGILEGLSKSPYPILWPIHPRTRKRLRTYGISLPPTIRPIDPVSYLEMIFLELKSAAVWTDSGGVQKEAVVLGKRCYTLRDETEWVETVREGYNRLVGTDPAEILCALKGRAWEKPRRPFPTKKYYGDGRAADRIAGILAQNS